MFKVFPCGADKTPLIKDWQNQATNDQAQINLWRELFKGKLAYFGIPTGPVNGLLVLDVDVKSGENGYETIKNLSIPQTKTQPTRSGGIHYLFKYPHDGKTYGNKVKFKPGLDIRGAGGYVCYYGTDETPLSDPPQWLLEDTAKPVYVGSGATIKVAPEIAQGIILGSLEAIRCAGEGESNNVLNTESFRIGQLVASGSVSREYAEIELFKAAKMRGKPDYEAKATITSGLNGGAQKPLSDPFGEPVALITIPPPPQLPGRWTPSYFTKYDLLNTSHLRRPQLFEHWSTEDIHITTADGGTGKTTLKLYEAICLALGERFLGFECKQRGKTLFITGEDTDKKLAAMIGAIMRQMGLFDDEEKVQTVLNSIVIKKDSDLCLIAKDKQGFLHMNSESLRKVLEAVEDIKPKMIVFDPISSFWGSESALNDMNKAVIKFVSALVDQSNACVEMINHMGKQSSANKDVTQFAGRGGTGLPSNARVCRVLMSLNADEYNEETGETLEENQSAMKVVVNKFTDGSPLYNRPFVILRTGFLFSRKDLTPQRAREAEEKLTDNQRVFAFIKEARSDDKFPTRGAITSYFMSHKDSMSEARVKRAIEGLQFSGYLGEKLKPIDNPDLSTGGKAFVIIDEEGREL
jgi:RecA-family ATPase